MSHPMKALNHKMTDSCIMKRRDKQRQVAVLCLVRDVERYRRTAAQTLFRHGRPGGIQV